VRTPPAIINARVLKPDIGLKRPPGLAPGAADSKMGEALK
jgi:hypothetical protein